MAYSQPGHTAPAADLPFDIFVVGGGVNGCGIARDAVGRGYKVHLAEMNDSQHFWRVVAKLSPDFEAARGWLKRNGPQLLRYG